MRIKSASGDLPFKRFSFPDGQRHFELLLHTEFREVTIEAPIRSSDELLDVLLATDALKASGYAVSLDIRYLLGARMDRRINTEQPNTLSVIAKLLVSAGYKKIRVLEPHSHVALRALNATAVWPASRLRLILDRYALYTTVIIAPDIGAAERTKKLVHLATDYPFIIAQAHKKRDPNTGALSGFELEDPSLVHNKTCLIVDDICDGGGTFVGLSNLLLEHGASFVDLYVTHGIFSKGLPLFGIRTVYTTDSYADVLDPRTHGAIILKVEMDKEPE